MTLLEIAQYYTGMGKPYCLFYSAYQASHTGQYSYLLAEPLKTLAEEDWKAFEKALEQESGFWAGYLGYDLRHALEDVPRDAPHDFDLTNLWMACFQTVLRYDHATETLEVLSGQVPKDNAEYTARVIPEVHSLRSNMDKATYLSGVETLIEAIHAGDLSEANLTRKFSGKFARKPDALSLFTTMIEVTPSPYMALIDTGAQQILSSSPERFLTIDVHGKVVAEPIKGTIKRHNDPTKDKALKDALYHSVKNRAENLMIVDLMRNDMTRSAKIGSVSVPDLFKITSYETLHHMSSVITASLREGHTNLDMVKHCFPPGSMTGAPKIKAMEWCSRLEQQSRGVYSGAIGWFNSQTECDLSVVIRTLIIEGDQFEFQVGGAIVADSTAEDEWQETMVKAKGICQTLGIKISQLDQL